MEAVLVLHRLQFSNEKLARAQLEGSGQQSIVGPMTLIQLEDGALNRGNDPRDDLKTLVEVKHSDCFRLRCKFEFVLNLRIVVDVLRVALG